MFLTPLSASSHLTKASRKPSWSLSELWWKLPTRLAPSCSLRDICDMLYLIHPNPLFYRDPSNAAKLQWMIHDNRLVIEGPGNQCLGQSPQLQSVHKHFNKGNQFAVCTLSRYAKAAFFGSLGISCCKDKWSLEQLKAENYRTLTLNSYIK